MERSHFPEKFIVEISPCGLTALVEKRGVSTAIGRTPFISKATPPYLDSVSETNAWRDLMIVIANKVRNLPSYGYPDFMRSLAKASG